MEYETVETLMFTSSIGMIVLPVVFLTASYLILRTDRLLLKKYFTIYFLALAILSMPFCYLMAISCAKVVDVK
jgi:hypothetical protein